MKAERLLHPKPLYTVRFGKQPSSPQNWRTHRPEAEDNGRREAESGNRENLGWHN